MKITLRFQVSSKGVFNVWNNSLTKDIVYDKLSVLYCTTKGSGTDKLSPLVLKACKDIL